MGTANQDTAAAALRMKAYIDANIREPITAKLLADAAGYSQYHAARIFKQHTGRMPFEYIRERRLINAALALRRGGAKVVDLPPCKLLVFQGEPFGDDEFEEAIGALWERIEKFDPEVYGYEYADELAPRMQLAPMGWRGYIEMRPIREIKR